MNPTHTVWVVDENLREHHFDVSIDINKLLWPSSLVDVIYVLPLIGVAFGCHVNVLPIHQELTKPTWKRIRYVTYCTMAFCCVLFLITSYSGFLYAAHYTCGNILLNFSSGDFWINCVRIFLSLHLFLAIPLIVLPCRLAAQKCYDVFVVYYCKRRSNSSAGSRHVSLPSGNSKVIRHQTQLKSVVEDASSIGSIQAENFGSSSAHGDSYEKMPETESESSDRFPADNENLSDPSFDIWYILKTVAIVFSALAVSLFVPSILVLWTVVGGTVSFAICIWIPALLYFKHRTDRPCTFYKVSAIVVLIFGITASILCTWQAAVRIDQPACEMVSLNSTKAS